MRRAGARGVAWRGDERPGGLPGHLKAPPACCRYRPGVVEQVDGPVFTKLLAAADEPQRQLAAADPAFDGRRDRGDGRQRSASVANWNPGKRSSPARRTGSALPTSNAATR
jgi:hypothetical protein